MSSEISKIDLQRIADLEENIELASKLRKDCEAAILLLDIDDVIRKERINRQIMRLKESIAQYQQEYDDLQTKVTLKSPQLATAGSELQELKDQINILQITLQADLKDLQAMIITSFNGAEQAIITAVVARLDQVQLITTQVILSSVKANQIPQQELQETLSAVQAALAEIQQQGGIAHLSKSETEHLTRLIEEPTLDMGHKLALTIPIIPFILSYQGEIGLQSGLNLKEAWKRLITRVRGHADTN